MTAYPPPPNPDTASGDPRRIGVEIEFGGVSVQKAATLTRDLAGGEIEAHSAQACTVRGASIGDLGFELDMPERPRDAFAPTGDARDDGPARAVTGAIVSWLVPVELVAPPLPPDRLPELHPLIEALRRAGATGAGHGAQTAYGMHLNIELASQDVLGILPILRAFALLEHWLRAALEIDVSRRLTGFVRAYPRDYITLLADMSYAPDLTGLIKDYLRHNPTRNRALDMTPAFALLAPEATEAALIGQKVRPRPTFHYRLPDARADEPGWTPARDWMMWRLIESAAATPALMDALCLGWAEHLDDWAASRPDWVLRCADMLRAAGLIGAHGAPN
ncbi:MAG: hypothetical protein ACJA1L_000946 [Paracoccaceae bacterium]|jgi:hypothetical protein